MTNDIIDKQKVTFTCRFHPTDWFHEIGCPDMEWSKEDLLGAIKTHKRVLAYHDQIFREHPEILKYFHILS